jgi:hypothetical protein
VIASLRDVRAALAEALAAGPDSGGGGFGMRVYDVLPAGAAQLPALVVGWPTLVDFTSGTLNGASDMTIPITVVVALGSDATQSQRKLDDLVDGELASALADAVDPPWQYLQVVRVEAFRTITIGETTSALAADFIIELLA